MRQILFKPKDLQKMMRIVFDSTLSLEKSIAQVTSMKRSNMWKHVSAKARDKTSCGKSSRSTVRLDSENLQRSHKQADRDTELIAAPRVQKHEERFMSMLPLHRRKHYSSNAGAKKAMVLCTNTTIYSV